MNITIKQIPIPTPGSIIKVQGTNGSDGIYMIIEELKINKTSYYDMCIQVYSFDENRILIFSKQWFTTWKDLWETVTE